MKQGIFLLLLLIGWFWWWQLIEWSRENAWQNDFCAYYFAATELAEGDPIYKVEQTSCIYLYPPLLGQMLMPVMQSIDYDTAQARWFDMNLLLFFGGLLALTFALADNTHRLMLWMMALTFSPMIHALWVAQISLLIFFLTALAWFFIKTERRILAGAVLALATWIKVYPIFLLLYYLWRRDWRVVQGGLVVGFGLLFAQIILSPPTYLWNYLTYRLPNLMASGETFTFQYNASFLGQTLRLFVDTDYNQPLIHAPDLVYPMRTLLLLIMVSVTLFALWRGRNTPTPQREATEFALMTVLSLWFGPTLWASGMPPLLVAYMLIIPHEKRRNLQRLLWLSFLLICIYYPIELARPETADWSWVVHSIGFGAVTMLWLALIYTVLRPAPIAVEPDLLTDDYSSSGVSQ